MIVDPHLHVWQPMPQYPDQAATTLAPASAVLMQLFYQYMDEHGVDRAVLVQPVYPGEDNSYVADCATADPDRIAAVCVVDPRKQGAEDRLEYWVKERGCKGLRLRPRVPEEEASFGDPSTFPLWERAQSLGIAINVLGNCEHLKTVAQIAERFSDMDILIDHMAHPEPRDGVDAPLFEDLLALAKYPRVHVKVSGQPYYSHSPYPYDDCVELVKRVYDEFGPQRMIWGSDFPHVLLQSGYRRARHLVERAFSFITEDERALVMGENAGKIYWR